MDEGQLRSVAAALDGLEVALCAFDDEDRTVAWNQTFLDFFPEHAGHVHAGEPYDENLRRFYRSRLSADELPLIERYVAEGIERHRAQLRPYEFDHQGHRVRVSSLPMHDGGRVRVWRRVPLLGSAPSLTPLGTREADWQGASTPMLDGIADGILIVDAGDRVLWANRALLQLYGIPSLEHALKQSFEALYREAWRESPRAEVFVRSLEVLRENQRFSGAPYELALPSARWVRVVEQRGHTTDGLGYFVHVDITALKAKNEALRLAESRSRESEAKLRTISNSVPVFISEWTLDEKLVFANRAACEFVGIDPATAAGRSLLDVRGAAAYELLQPYLAIVRTGQRVDFDATVTLKGASRHFQQSYLPSVDADGVLRGFLSVAVDVSERRRSEEALRSITEAIPAMVAVVDRTMRYRFVNTAFERWVNLSRAQIVGHTITEILGADAYTHSHPWALKALAGETVSFERDFAYGDRRRQLSVTYIPLRLESGEVDGFVGVVQDITAYKDEAHRLLQLSERDALTGLLNRHGFEAFLSQRAIDGQASGLALLYIDLDHFKPVNDSHGHPIGDEVLRSFADRIRRLVRPTDGVARIGGDEFAIVLEGVHERANAELVADKVVAAATEPFVVDGVELRIGASVGVALDDGQGWKQLIVRADEAVYSAKAGGRGRRA